MEEGASLYHVSIAVRDIAEAEQLYSKLIGLEVVHREVVEEQGVSTSMLRSRDGKGTAIELVEPLDENSPITKFLERRGEGIHHICFMVDDIEASLEKLKEQEVKLIDEHPRDGSYNSRVAFIHPKAMNGVLVELAEIKKD